MNEANEALEGHLRVEHMNILSRFDRNSGDLQHLLYIELSDGNTVKTLMTPELLDTLRVGIQALPNDI